MLTYGGEIDGWHCWKCQSVLRLGVWYAPGDAMPAD